MTARCVVKGARVIDGTGAPWFYSDVLVEAGRIVAVEKGLDASQVVNAEGLCLCPGFIDIHSHSDVLTMVDSRAAAKTQQGVTTEVVGQCGSSVAPLTATSRKMAVESRSQLPVVPSWATMAQYLDEVEKRKTVVNLASLVGHGTLRNGVVGPDDRPASAQEIGLMTQLLDEALKEGAFGLSSGLEYPPGFFASTEELASVARACGLRGGIYATHMRNEDRNLLESVQEAIRVGRESGAPVEISHLKAIGPSYWGKVRQALDLMEDARRGGVDVTCDVYPYTASSTTLGIVLPEWAHSGGREATLERLMDPESRARISEEADSGTRNLGGWERVTVTSAGSDANRKYEGMDVAAIAASRGVPPVDAALDLLIEDEMQVNIVRHAMDPAEVEMLLAHPLSMVCSDGWAYAKDGPLSGVGKVHPRSFGTFPRVLSYFVREKKALTLENAVRKMTSLPAARLGLSGRGLLKAGFWADLVLFDPDKIRDTATFVDPISYPEGIRGVWVNGLRVLSDGRYTGDAPGRALRMGRNG